jgi:anthranilate phosphoribosyltransferase
VVGVYADALVAPLAAALGRLGSERALVVHGSDGLDEITTTGATHAALLEQGSVRTLAIDPAELGVARAAPAQLRGGDAQENAAIVRGILAGEGGPRRDIVCVNAAAALWVAEAAADLAGGLRLACESIDSGAARERLARLVEASAA